MLVHQYCAVLVLWFRSTWSCLQRNGSHVNSLSSVNATFRESNHLLSDINAPQYRYGKNTTNGTRYSGDRLQVGEMTNLWLKVWDYFFTVYGWTCVTWSLSLLIIVVQTLFCSSSNSTSSYVCPWLAFKEAHALSEPKTLHISESFPKKECSHLLKNKTKDARFFSNAELLCTLGQASPSVLGELQKSSLWPALGTEICLFESVV